MPLAHTFNMSRQEGIVPLEWKEANIIPLLKKIQETIRKLSTSQFNISNFQVLESIITDHMVDFLSKFKSKLYFAEHPAVYTNYILHPWTS